VDSKSSSTRKKTTSKTPGRNGRLIQLLFVFLAVVGVANTLVGDRGLLAMMRARHEYDQLAATLARQRAENARLREQVRRLKEDPAAIEEIARRELGLIRPDEKVFIIKDVAPPKP
jgi:cell division protein FtsB